MFLSQLVIDVGDDPARPRPGRDWIRKPYRIHQRLCMAFPSTEQQEEDDFFVHPFQPNPIDVSQPMRWTEVHVRRGAESGFLFRVDSDSPAGVVVLVQSIHEPNWKYAFRNARFLLRAEPREPRVISFHPSFRSEGRYRFRLRANVTKKVATRTKEERLANKPKNNGHRAPIFGDAQQLAWLAEKQKGYLLDGRTFSGGFRLV